MKRRNFLGLLAATATPAVRAAENSREIAYVVPNMHDDAIGWLASFYIERNYCLYSYLDHQDLAVKDPNYRYVFSEIPNLITMIEFEPERFEELKGLIKQERVEIPNAFVCESTINLSGGEALVMQVVEGLRWYRQVMNLRPPHAYCIDVCGWHEQMAQIVTGLELESFIYCRYNPTIDVPTDAEMVQGGLPMHWIESPDGTRALAVTPGHYTGAFRNVMMPTKPLTPDKLRAELTDSVKRLHNRWARFPKGTPMLTFAGQADYSLSFNYKGYPKELLEVWDASHPDTQIRFATLRDWFNAIRPGLVTGKYELPLIKTGSKAYGFDSFWVMAPKSKQWYRRSEHACQASEALATIASLKGALAYPSQEYSNAWFLLAMNMGRGPLWGIAVSGVYLHDKGWDVRDRFETVDAIAQKTTAHALPLLLGGRADTLGFYNPVNWERDEPIEVTLPAGRTARGIPAQSLEDGKTVLLRAKLPSMGVRSLALEPGAPPAARHTNLPDTIETKHYSAKVDSQTGALTSLRLKPSGREVLAGPANVITAQIHLPEVQPKNPGRFNDWGAHNLLPRASRKVVASSSEGKTAVTVSTGPLATVVEMTCLFPGGDLRRTIRFYNDSPRIDFITETNDLPNGTVVAAEFPLAGEVTDLRRGIPYGFSHGECEHGPKGNNAGIVPVIRWSDYSLSGGGGVAILDRGVPGRELVGNTALVLLHYTIDEYYSDHHTNWMSGRGKQTYQYALLAHDAPWSRARVPQFAWSYNAPPLTLPGVGLHSGESFLETSGNVIAEALRRVDDEIEIRMVETVGASGTAAVKVRLPHQAAFLTNMIGNKRIPLKARSSGAGAAEYAFEIRPQQIVTLRLKVRDAVPAIRCLTTFDPVVPEHKRLFTRSFKHPEYKAYPPRSSEEMSKIP